MPHKPFKALSDLELVARYREEGRQEILGELFTRYTGLVYGTCLKYLKNRDDAQDSVMQVFEKLTVSLRQHQVETFKSWLYVTTRNHCLMHLRAQKGKKTQDIDDLLMETPLLMHLEDEPEMEQNLSKLERCIGELGLDQQQCVKLFYLQEKCYKEISVETGFDLNQVKSFIQNGKRNLKICMEK